MRKGTKPLKGIIPEPKLRWDEDEWLFLLVMLLPMAFLVSLVIWILVIRFFFH